MVSALVALVAVVRAAVQQSSCIARAVVRAFHVAAGQKLLRHRARDSAVVRDCRDDGDMVHRLRQLSVSEAWNWTECDETSIKRRDGMLAYHYHKIQYI